MMRFCHLLTATVLFTLPLLATANASKNNINPGINAAELSQTAPIHWLSVEQLSAELENTPALNVGFDIDDTLLFSSAGFYHGKQVFSPGSDAYLSNPKFWQQMNNAWDDFSLPKKSARALIAMHLARGDRLWFITGRHATRQESLSRRLQQLFNIPQSRMQSVIFTNDNPGIASKVAALKARQIQIYYGDADKDMQAAKSAGARGIRVLRASNSSYLPLPAAGNQGESVLINSQD
jgi:acid phosphatase (class B)